MSLKLQFMSTPGGSENRVPWFEKKEGQEVEKMAPKENPGIWTKQDVQNVSQQLDEKNSRELEEYLAIEAAIYIGGAILFFVVFTFVILFASL